jgi:hypothetical protein
MAKALGIVDKNDANRLQPIDSRPSIGLTQFQRPRRQLSEEGVTRFKLCKVPHSFIRRHDPAGRPSDLYASNGRKIRVIRRHRDCNTRICLYFPGMPRIGLRYPDERQSVACVEQACCMRSAQTGRGKRHHVVRHEKSAYLLAEFDIHDRPMPYRGPRQFLQPCPRMLLPGIMSHPLALFIRRRTLYPKIIRRISIFGVRPARETTEKERRLTIVLRVARQDHSKCN